MLPLATVVPVSSAAPFLVDAQFSGADTVLGTVSVARATSESCLPGMGPCKCRGCRFSAHSLLLTLQRRKFACFVLFLQLQGKKSLGKGQVEEFRLVFYSQSSLTALVRLNRNTELQEAQCSASQARGFALHSTSACHQANYDLS